MLRSPAAIPIALPAPLTATTPFATTDINDIAAAGPLSPPSAGTGFGDFAPYPGTSFPRRHRAAIGAVHRGATPAPCGTPPARLTLPLTGCCASAPAPAISSNFLGLDPTRPPALRSPKMQRGIKLITPFLAAGLRLSPRALSTQSSPISPATVQEHWFTRLFLLKPLIFGGLALFWIISGSSPWSRPSARASTSSSATASRPRAATAIASAPPASPTSPSASASPCVGPAEAPGAGPGALRHLPARRGRPRAPSSGVEPLGSLVKTAPATKSSCSPRPRHPRQSLSLHLAYTRRFCRRLLQMKDALVPSAPTLPLRWAMNEEASDVGANSSRR